MDKFLAPHTPEAAAHNHLRYSPIFLFSFIFSSYFPYSENWFNWDSDHPSFNETLVAGGASYHAFERYLSGADLFLHPCTRDELESIL